MSASETNRQERRDAKRDKRRHGQRGGTGKRMFLIQEQTIKRAAEAEHRLQTLRSPQPKQPDRHSHDSGCFSIFTYSIDITNL